MANCKTLLHNCLYFTANSLARVITRMAEADESVLTSGKIDVGKLKPLMFDMASVMYWRLGPPIGDCWNVGKSLKKAGQ